VAVKLAPHSAWILLAALFLTGLGPVQDGKPPSERERIVAQMKVLKDPRRDDEAKDIAMVELLFLGLDGPRALAAWLERDLASRRKQGAKDELRLLGEFESRATRQVAQRLKGSAQLEVEEQRAVVRRNSRDRNLTKKQVQEESDPAYARLVELMTTDPSAVWAENAELREEWESFLDGIDRELYLIGTWEAARAALQAAPGGNERLAERAVEDPTPPPRDVPALLAELERRAQLATPMSQTDRRVLDENGALATTVGEELEPGQLGPEEKRGVLALNLRRILIGLPAQRIDIKLVAACRGHSKDMKELGFFAHESPVKGKKTPWDRAAAAGTSAGSENIARGAQTGPDAILQWWYSPGHHRNMMGGGSRTALGRYDDHWTQCFGG